MNDASTAPAEAGDRKSFPHIDRFNAIVERGWLRKLSWLELRVYWSALYHMNGATLQVWMSSKTIANYLQYSHPNHVQKALRRLTKMGLMEVRAQGGAGKTTRFSIPIPPRRVADDGGLQDGGGMHTATVGKLPTSADRVADDGGLQVTDGGRLPNSEGTAKRTAKLTAKPFLSLDGSASLPFSSDEFKSAWGRWIAHKHECRKPVTASSQRCSLKSSNVGESQGQSRRSITASPKVGHQSMKKRPKRMDSRQAKQTNSTTAISPAKSESSIDGRLSADDLKNISFRDEATIFWQDEVKLLRVTPREMHEAIHDFKRRHPYHWNVEGLFNSKAGAACVPGRYADALIFGLGKHLPARYLEAAKVLDRLIDKPGTVALIGPRGVGKTHLGCALANAFNLHRDRQALYKRAMDCFTELKATFSNNSEISQQMLLERWTAADLFVCDEVQVRSDSAWENSTLTTLIDRRYAENRATLLISNLTADKFVEKVGNAIASRVMETGGIVKCEWPSFRDSMNVPNS